MPLIDKLFGIPGLKWAGNTNELNAAYAADGYSRLKGLGVLITTFGVGELSAINGIAGSFAEHVGVLHVVGMPPTSAQSKQLLLHHTLGNGDYNVFHRMASDVACHTALIKDSDICADQIDECIRAAWLKQMPVYMGIPVNKVNILIPSKALNIPLDLNPPDNDPDTEQEVISKITDMMYRARNPAIIVDACVARYDTIKETRLLCEMTKFPVFVTPMGKGIIDEDSPQFCGVFTGSISSPSVREVVDFADFVLVIGCVLSEFSTSTFHFHYKTKRCILLYPGIVRFKSVTYPEVYLKRLLLKLISSIDTNKLHYKFQNPPKMNIKRTLLPDDALLRQDWVWSEISHWFQEGDVIITEIGSSSFGINSTHFPKHAKGISQSIWGSVGFSLGSCLGILFAIAEISKQPQNLRSKKPRVILFLGDGAFQLTVQEMSTIIRWGFKPYIFLMNNHGYSVDRYLHHRQDAEYYDIQPWNYLLLPKLFGATDYETRKVVTVRDFKNIVNDPIFASADRLRMLELMFPPKDVPQELIKRWTQERESYKNERDASLSVSLTSEENCKTPDSSDTHIQKLRKMNPSEHR